MTAIKTHQRCSARRNSYCTQGLVKYDRKYEVFWVQGHPGRDPQIYRGVEIPRITEEIMTNGHLAFTSLWLSRSIRRGHGRGKQSFTHLLHSHASRKPCLFLTENQVLFLQCSYCSYPRKIESEYSRKAPSKSVEHVNRTRSNF